MGGLTLSVGAITTGVAVGTFVLRNRLPTAALVVLGHAIASGGLIAAASSDALCDRTTWLLGKNPETGHFYPGTRFLAWPFHLLLHLRITLRWRRTSEPLFQQIADGWYISGWPYKADVLPNESDLSVIDCTCEYPRTHSKPYLCLPTWDTQGVTEDNLRRGVDYALQQRQLGRAVLVHCAHGHGRSAEVLLACMIASGLYKTHQEGLAAYKLLRKKCKLNTMQLRHLEAYLASVNAPASGVSSVN